MNTLKKHKFEKLLDLIDVKMKEVGVDKENFDTILELAAGGYAAVVPALGEFLGRHCPSSEQLVSFLASRPRLDPAVILEVVLAIPERDEVQKIELHTGCKTLYDFLQFVQF